MFAHLHKFSDYILRERLHVYKYLQHKYNVTILFESLDIVQAYKKINIYFFNVNYTKKIVDDMHATAVKWDINDMLFK